MPPGRRPLLRTIILQIMEANDWNVREAAEHLGVSPAGVSNWLNRVSETVGTKQTARCLAHLTEANIGHVFKGQGTAEAWLDEREALDENPNRPFPKITRITRPRTNGVAPESEVSHPPTVTDLTELQVVPYNPDNDEIASNFIDDCVANGSLTQADAKLLEMASRTRDLPLSVVLAGVLEIAIAAHVNDLANDPKTRKTVVTASKRLAADEANALFDEVAAERTLIELG